MSNRFWNKETSTSFYHIIIKVPDNTAGNSAYAFNSSHKTYLENLLFRLDSLYFTDVLSYAVMSTHVHIIIAQRNGIENSVSLKETAGIYKEYYKLKEAPDARSYEVRTFRKRLNSLSDFMRDLQRRFTFWYNNQFPEKRRGSLWNPRFKSVSLTSIRALSECMKYVELNPVRAKMVTSAGEYEFCSWYHIVKKDYQGKLLKKRIVEYFREMIGEEASLESDAEIFLRYAADLETLCIEVAKNKSVKRLDPYQQEFLLSRCDLWSRLNLLGGDDVLTGTGYGGHRPRVMHFELESK